MPKFEAKDKVFYTDNGIIFKECIIIGYILDKENITYRLLNILENYCFDTKENQLISYKSFLNEKRSLVINDNSIN